MDSEFLYDVGPIKDAYKITVHKAVEIDDGHYSIKYEIAVNRKPVDDYFAANGYPPMDWDANSIPVSDEDCCGC